MLVRLPDPEAVRRPEHGSSRLQGELSVTEPRQYSDMGVGGGKGVSVSSAQASGEALRTERSPGHPP